MKANTKKYLTVSLTLGLIASLSAFLIGLVNFITEDRIAQNELDKEQNGLAEVYDNVEGETFKELTLDKEYTYVSKLWDVTYNSEDLGFIYKTAGKNSYGNVSLLLGISKEGELGNIVLLENTETYGSTLEENYVDKYNAGTRDLSDTSCGATYGAKLVKAMVDEALNDYKERVK